VTDRPNCCPILKQIREGKTKVAAQRVAAKKILIQLRAIPQNCWQLPMTFHTNPWIFPISSKSSFHPSTNLKISEKKL
jgi:hypothetical protein